MINTGFREKISRFFSRAVVYILWALFAFFLWTFVFNGISDTSRDKKVTMYINAIDVDSVRLSAALEESMPPGIRMVKAKPFLYSLLGSEDLLNSDLYIIRESDYEEFRESFSGMGHFQYKHPEYTYHEFAEDVSGILVYDQEADVRIGADYINYTRIEENEKDTAVLRYYLMFGRNSHHTGEDAVLLTPETLSVEADDAAVAIAEAFLRLNSGK